MKAVAPEVGWLLAAIGFALAAAVLPFLDEVGTWLFAQASFFLAIAALAVGLFHGIGYALDHYVEIKGEDIDQRVAADVVLLTRRLSTLVIVILLILIVAEHLGVNVLALTAALGLTGFALALSLKDTITNFISGIVIMISRPYIVGETIHIPELGATAKVDAIGIRSTTVVTPDHRLVTVPNSLAVDNLISNYSRLDNTHRLQVDLGLGTEVDLDHAREAIRVEVRKVDGVLPDKPVDVLFTGFGASTNTVRVRWWVSSYQEHRHSMDKVNSAIVEVTTREDISLPYPIITIDEHVPSAPGRTPSKAAPEDATAPSDQS